MSGHILNHRQLSRTALSLYEDVRAILSYSSAILKKYRKQLVIVSVFRAISFPMGLALIYVTKAALDRGIMSGDLRLFMTLTALGAGIFLLERGLGYFAGILSQKVRAGFSTGVNYDLTRRLFGLDYLKIKELSTAENAFILNYDYRNIENLVFSEIPSLISVLKVPVLLALALRISVPLTVLVIFAVPFAAYHALWAARGRRQYRTKEFRHLRRHTSRFYDILSNIKLVKSLAEEDWALREADSLYRRRAESALGSSLFFLKTRVLGDILSRFSMLAFGLLGGFLIISGRLSIGSFSAVSMFAYLVVSELQHAGSVFEELSGERMSLKRCAAFINDISAEPAGKVFDELEESDLERDIEFAGVSFGYAKDRRLFDKISLMIPSRRWTLIKGPSGSGKTTLMGLLIGLFPPEEGAVFLGEKDLRRANRKRFLDRVSVVHQEPYLFNDTLANNILLGRERDIRKAEKAILCSRVDEVADGLLMGYNTRIGEAGSSLSGGQRQRVAIARARAREPKILVLDEATSFLDSGMEGEIFTDLRGLYPDLTVIFITHRDTAVRYADEIISLENGRIANAGNVQCKKKG